MKLSLLCQRQHPSSASRHPHPSNCLAQQQRHVRCNTGAQADRSSGGWTLLVSGDPIKGTGTKGLAEQLSHAWAGPQQHLQQQHLQRRLAQLILRRRFTAVLLLVIMLSSGRKLTQQLEQQHL